jgi:DNA-binding FadR family transcriptional regulator
MCEAYGVSRSSVREALRVLAEKGLIEVRHGLGPRVNPPERWDFLDALVIGARRRVGGMAAVIRDLLEAVRIVDAKRRRWLASVPTIRIASEWNGHSMTCSARAAMRSGSSTLRMHSTKRSCKRRATTS